MVTRFLKTATTIIALAFLLSGCQTKPVLNISDTSVYPEQTIEQVERAIIKAGRSKGWRTSVVKPGLIRAEINVRSHFAAVDIAYSADSYSIKYADSTNLKYDGAKIHRNYNKWISFLDQQIQNQLSYQN